MTNAPRLRFAPSPTGYFHVGSGRTALYNWLVARRAGGTFILRIDDTDEARNKEEFTSGILAAMEWLDITYDEGPYFQSKRSHLYSAMAERLYGLGRAYYCDCTREDIDERAKARGGAPGYDGFCRDRGVLAGEGRALRFRVDHAGSTIVRDAVRGEVTFENKVIDDFILLKGNGASLYVLANFVDDVDLAITHVIRAEEHLPTTPKAVMLYEALDIEPPVFAHLPVLVNEKRVKLSKRRDRVAVEDFRDQGFLPEAITNYLVLLGWSPGGDREFLSRAEMLELFSLDQVGHSPSYFDVARMTHFNKHYIGEMENERFCELSFTFLEGCEFWRGDDLHKDTFRRIAPLVKGRIALMSEVVEMTDFLFRRPSLDEASSRSILDAGAMLKSLWGALDSVLEWSAVALESAARSYSEESEISLRKLQAPLRLAITGRKIGPPLFEAMEILGREECTSRVKGAGEP